jgi:Tfp pilus assembly protein PilF
MKKNFKIFSFALLATASLQAQDLDQAVKAIDAEQYEKAKSLLKSIYQAKPNNGKAAFLLGNVYLKQNIEDSAKIFFQKGLEASENGKLNNIGFGQIELDKGNITGAKAKFDLATKDMRKKDIQEYIYVANAYVNSEKPNYKAAIEVLNKAKAINPMNAEVLLALGDAYYGDKNQNEAYSAYRAAFNADSSLLRAKMQLGVLLKGAKAFTEADKALNEVKAINPNYGPVYRELAETYYLWANHDVKQYNSKIAQALQFYEKYMSLTDYSLTSRMRHADFLIISKDYKALEVEANKMKELDNVNPRILRYLGYSAFENGNIDLAIKSLVDYTSNSSNKIIARDFFYLGKARLKKASDAEGKIVNQASLDQAMADIKKAMEIDPGIAGDLNEIGKTLYEQKQFGLASSVFELAVSNPDSKNYVLDNFYLGNSIYYNNTRKDITKPDAIALQKADTAFGVVIEQAPSTFDAYIFRARTNKLMENDEQMAKYYEEYMKVVSDKGPDEVTKNKAKFIEAYNNIAAHYANFDKTKAKEYFNKTLSLDPANNYALESLKILK